MEKILDFIKENNLIHPNYNELNALDVVKCLYKRLGANIENNKNIDELDKIIPYNKHYIYILSDGTGSNIIEKLNKNSILYKNKVKDLVTIFPSTTGCVLTSLATAKYPIEHGTWGWYNYLREYNLEYTPLTFSERKTLNELEFKPENIYKEKSKLNELKINTSAFYPNFMVDSEFSKFVLNNNRYGYDDFDDILKDIKKIIKNNNESYTYIYLPNIDSLEHKYGTDDDIVINELKRINNFVKELSKLKDTTILFTADHGQYSVKEDILLDFDKYDKYFYAYPTIDYGTASYYVKEEYKDEFIKEFEKDFKNKMYLFETKEFLNNNLFGFGYNEKAYQNLGEFISLCNNDSYLINNKETVKYYKQIKGNHSGLQEDEMIVPLIIINTKKRKT